MGEGTGDAKRLGQAPLHFVCVVRMPDGTDFEREYGPYENTVHGICEQQFAAGFVVGYAAACGVGEKDVGLRMYEGDKVVDRTGCCRE